MRFRRSVRLAGFWLLPLIGCAEGGEEIDAEKLQEFGARYTAAWSSHDPASVASFYNESGSLKVNDGEPAVGREAITAVAEGFMTAFPDMTVVMDSLRTKESTVEYHWTFIGTNTGPEGTGNAVRFSGYEEWTLGEDGLIASSLGRFDETEYNRQLEFGVDGLWPGTRRTSGRHAEGKVTQPVVSLEAIVEALDAANDEWESFLDPETGEVITVTDEDRMALENPESESDAVPAWQQELLPKIREAVESGRFPRLPDSFEIHEWSIMDRFGHTLEEPSARSEVLDAIRGASAFRSFRRTIDRHGLLERWYEYRKEAFEQVARDWLGEHGIPFK